MTEDAASDHQAQRMTGFAPGTNAPRDAEELLEARVGSVDASVVHLEKSRAETVRGARVAMRQSAAQQVEAGSMQLQRSAVGLARTTDLAMHDSAALLVSTGEARLQDSVVLAMRAGSVTGEGRNAILLNIGPAGDDATIVLTGTTALRLGASLALTLLVAGQIVRRLFGRSRER